VARRGFSGPAQREKHERLCRYISRPPVVSRRLVLTASGPLRYALRTPNRDGAAHLLLEPLDLMARRASAAGRRVALDMGPVRESNLVRIW
jgi:hypothetical protein